MKPIVAAAAALLFAGCASTPAEAQPPPPCAAAEFRQMDFWVGVWDVRWEASAGLGVTAGQGTNTITRELGECVIQEHFEGGPSTGGLIGHSVSVFHRQAGRWRQTWVDNFGGYFALVGGPEGDRFVLTNTRLSDDAPHLRMVYEEITPSSLTWRWQRSVDGGATWSDSWVIYYTRRAP